MTREELLADIDEATQAFAEQIVAQDEETTGVPKPPKIEVTESQLEPTKFDFDLQHDPRSEAEGLPESGGGGGGPPEPTVGACCMEDETCTETNEDDCGDIGGTYQGDDTDCGSVDCTQPTGACCDEFDECSIQTEHDCTFTVPGGVYQGNGTDCGTSPCGETGACCSSIDGTCEITSEDGCAGVYRGDGTDCVDTTCTDCFLSTIGELCAGCLLDCGTFPLAFDMNCVNTSAYECCVMEGGCIDSGCDDCAIHRDPFDGTCWYMKGKQAACSGWGFFSLDPDCTPCCLIGNSCA